MDGRGMVTRDTNMLPAPKVFVGILVLVLDIRMQCSALESVRNLNRTVAHY